MTAGELIELLKAVYPDTEVVIEGPATYDVDIFHITDTNTLKKALKLETAIS